MKIFLWLFILATGDQQKLDNGIQQYQKLLQDLIQKDLRQRFYNQLWWPDSPDRKFLAEPFNRLEMSLTVMPRSRQCSPCTS